LTGQGKRITVLLGCGGVTFLVGWLAVLVIESAHKPFIRSLVAILKKPSFLLALFLVFLFAVVLRGFNKARFKGTSRKWLIFGYCILGLVIWFTPGLVLVYSSTRISHMTPLSHAYLVICFGQGLTFGIAMYFQERVELLAQRVFPHSRLLFRALGCLLGVLFLYAAFLLYCFPAVFVKLSITSIEEEGFIFAWLIPAGFVASVLFGVVNSVTNPLSFADRP
jgi:hypothetical protein